jgi:hypothetical protein
MQKASRVLGGPATSSEIGVRNENMPLRHCAVEVKVPAGADVALASDLTEATLPSDLALDFSDYNIASLHHSRRRPQESSIGKIFVAQRVIVNRAVYVVFVGYREVMSNPHLRPGWTPAQGIVESRVAIFLYLTREEAIRAAGALEAYASECGAHASISEQHGQAVPTQQQSSPALTERQVAAVAFPEQPKSPAPRSRNPWSEKDDDFPRLPENFSAEDARMWTEALGQFTDFRPSVQRCEIRFRSVDYKHSFSKMRNEWRYAECAYDIAAITRMPDHYSLSSGPGDSRMITFGLGQESADLGACSDPNGKLIRPDSASVIVKREVMRQPGNRSMLADDLRYWQNVCQAASPRVVAAVGAGTKMPDRTDAQRVIRWFAELQLGSGLHARLDDGDVCRLYATQVNWAGTLKCAFDLRLMPYKRAAVEVQTDRSWSVNLPYIQGWWSEGHSCTLDDQPVILEAYSIGHTMRLPYPTFEQAVRVDSALSQLIAGCRALAASEIRGAPPK